MRRPLLGTWGLFASGAVLLLASAWPRPPARRPPAEPPSPPIAPAPPPPSLSLAAYFLPAEHIEVFPLGQDEYLVGAKAVERFRREGIAQQMRVVPSFAQGRPQGFKLYSIRPSSLYSALGLQNGDIIERINEADVTEPDKALGVYAALKQARLVTVTLKRRGDRRTLRYFIPGTVEESKDKGP